jgi:hypothetical protein
LNRHDYKKNPWSIIETLKKCLKIFLEKPQTNPSKKSSSNPKQNLKKDFN